METQNRMAAAGAGLVVLGVGIGIVGALMVVPAVVVWTANFAEKTTDRLLGHAERASKTVGTVAGTLQRTFAEATKAGVAEIRKSAS